MNVIFLVICHNMRKWKMKNRQKLCKLFALRISYDKIKKHQKQKLILFGKLLKEDINNIENTINSVIDDINNI